MLTEKMFQDWLFANIRLVPLLFVISVTVCDNQPILSIRPVKQDDDQSDVDSEAWLEQSIISKVSGFPVASALFCSSIVATGSLFDLLMTSAWMEQYSSVIIIIASSHQEHKIRDRFSETEISLVED